MITDLDNQHQRSRSRYRHYFQQLSGFYQKPVAQVSTALLLTLFTIIFFAAFAIRPTLDTISQLIKKIDDQKEVLADLKKKAAALSVVQSEYTLITAQLPALNAAVPPTTEADQLLKMIEAVSAQHNLPISTMHADDITVGTPSAKLATDKKSEGTVISLTVEGNYLDIRAFLEDLNRMPRFITIDQLQFAPTSAANALTGVLSLTATIRAYTIEE